MAIPIKEHSLNVRTGVKREEAGSGAALPPGQSAVVVLCTVDNTDVAAKARQTFEEVQVVTDAMVIVYMDLADGDSFVPDRSEFDHQGVTYIVVAVKKQPSANTSLGHSIVLADRKAP